MIRMRDLIDAVMAGIIISNLGFWMVENKFQHILLIAGWAIVILGFILKFKRA